jgi:hypothetical protein
MGVHFLLQQILVTLDPGDSACLAVIARNHNDDSIFVCIEIVDENDPIING